MLSFPTSYGNGITYYGLGFWWTNYGVVSGSPPPPTSNRSYRTLTGVGNGSSGSSSPGVYDDSSNLVYDNSGNALTSV